MDAFQFYDDWLHSKMDEAADECDDPAIEWVSNEDAHDSFVRLSAELLHTS